MVFSREIFKKDLRGYIEFFDVVGE